MAEFEYLKTRRASHWRQDGVHNLPDPKAAASFLKQVHMCPVYPCSSEFPNLLHAYTGDPQTKVAASWDSASGHVYTWRWKLGQANAGFYSLLVAKKPTFVSWEALPAVFGVHFERLTVDELYDSGQLSPNALKIAQAFEGTRGILPTKELRNKADFPTGKEHRAAYGKAVEELEAKLMLAKVFEGAEDEEFMCHGWVETIYPDAVATALKQPPEKALTDVIALYLPSAVYLEPALFAKHFRVSKELLGSALEMACERGVARLQEIGGASLYVTTEESN
jgi:hypothetical protein